MKKCYIIAGPNGAGKTTFANDFLPIEAECLNFINAGLIGSGLSTFQPDKMGSEKDPATDIEQDMSNPEN